MVSVRRPRAPSESATEHSLQRKNVKTPRTYLTAERPTLATVMVYGSKETKVSSEYYSSELWRFIWMAVGEWVGVVFPGTQLYTSTLPLVRMAAP